MIDTPLSLNEINDLESLKNICMEVFIPTEGEELVFGEGPQHAKLMLIGEAPGKEEAKTGRVFIGNAGRILSKYLKEAEINRETAYITNVIKIRPPENRTPKKSEINEGLPFLERQIELVKPKIVVCLGKISVQAIVDPKAKISEIRGKWQQINNMKIMPTYHPASIFHDQEKKNLLKRDLVEVGKVLKNNSKLD